MTRAFRDSRSYDEGEASQTPPINVPFARPPGGPMEKNSLYGGTGSDPNARRVYVSEPQKYGAVQQQPFLLAVVPVSILLLAQSDTVRTYLFIQNINAAGDLWVNFGANAAVGNGFKIVAGANLFMDSFVAQDDIYIIGSAASLTGILGYSNLADFG